MIYVYYSTANEYEAREIVYEKKLTGACNCPVRLRKEEPLIVYGNATQVYTDSTEVRAAYELAGVEVTGIITED